MGLSNSKTKQESSSSTTNTLDPWSKSKLEGSWDDILGTINNFNTDHAWKPYEGEMVAGLSDGQVAARDYASSNIGSTAPLFNDAQGLIQKGAAAEWNPEQVGYKTYQSGDEQKFLNPFMTDVVDATGAYIDEQRNKEIMANQARATASGAYGGSRHGVADAELMRTAAMDKAGALADLKYQGFNDAMNRVQAENAGLYGADTFNASRKDAAAQWEAENAYRGAGALSDLAKSKQDSWMNEVGLMEQLGATDREIAQAKDLAARAQYDEKAADEWRRLQLELQTKIGLMGSIPLLTNSSSTGTSTTSKSGMDFAQIGSLLQGVGALSGFIPPVPVG